MRFAVVFLSVVTAALAQLTVNTPTGALSCLNQQITWTGGTSPYTIQVQPGGDPTQAALETFTGLTGNAYSWFVTEGPNTQVFLRLRDAAGTTVESGTFTIRAGGATCPAGGSTPTPSASGSTSAPAGSSSTTPAAPPPAGGTTTTAAAPTTTGTAAPGGTTSGSSSAATTRATTSTGAGLKMGVAGGMGVVVAGVVALLA